MVRRSSQQGPDPNADRHRKDLRSRSQRRSPTQGELDALADRDARAHARDTAALARDQLAELRDRALAERDARLAQHGYGSEVDQRLARMRDEAAEQRALATEDRERAANDREAAARDRLHAAADRGRAARALITATTDGRARARAREEGLADLQAEIDRTRRSGGRLVVARIDVIGLSEVREVERDPMLDRVLDALRRHLRSYDLIVRLGSEEVLCAISDVGIVEAEQRFEAIEQALAVGRGARPIEAEFRAVGPGDSAIALADGRNDEVRSTHPEA